MDAANDLKLTGQSKYEIYFKTLEAKVLVNAFVDPRLLSSVALEEAQESLSGLQAVKNPTYRDPNDTYVSGLDKMILILATNKETEHLVADRLTWKGALFNMKNVSFERKIEYCTMFMLKYQGKINESNWVAKMTGDGVLMIAHLAPFAEGAAEGREAPYTGYTKREKHVPPKFDTSEYKQDRRDRGRGKGKAQKTDRGGKEGGKGGKGSVRVKPLAGGPCKSRLDPKAVCMYETSCRFKHWCICCAGSHDHPANKCKNWDQAKADKVAQQFNLPTVGLGSVEYPQVPRRKDPMPEVHTFLVLQAVGVCVSIGLSATNWVYTW
jgi:hypothetical protein